jgi:putative membrane protein
LLSVFSGWWVVLAIAPAYRQDWLLENVLVLVAIPLLVLNYRRLRLSNLAYTCLFAFLVLHEVGAHYTYSEVPWRQWLGTLSAAIPEGRNDYDRLLHFLYGLLVAPAAIELLDARAPQRGSWRWLLPMLFMLSHAAIYELVEWLAADIFGGNLGQAYLGTQGDSWDSQKDTALAAAGAVISVTLCRLTRVLAERRRTSA